MTSSVVGALIPTMRHAEIERAKHRPTENADAHMTHMRGVASLYLWTKAGVDEALRSAYEAMKLDPDYSMAYGLAATCYVARRTAGWTTDRAKEAAEVEMLTKRGAEVGRDDAWALGPCGFATASILGDLDTAVSLMDRALAVNANMALMWAQSAYVRAWLGEPELALVHVERAKRLSPVDPHMFTMYGAEAMAHFVAGRHDEAFAAAESALRLNPFFSQGTRIMRSDAANLGRMEEVAKNTSPGCRCSIPNYAFPTSAIGSFFAGRMISPNWRRACGRVACLSEIGERCIAARGSPSRTASAHGRLGICRPACGHVAPMTPACQRHAPQAGGYRDGDHHAAPRPRLIHTHTSVVIRQPIANRLSIAKWRTLAGCAVQNARRSDAAGTL